MFDNMVNCLRVVLGISAGIFLLISVLIHFLPQSPERAAVNKKIGRTLSFIASAVSVLGAVFASPIAGNILDYRQKQIRRETVKYVEMINHNPFLTEKTALIGKMKLNVESLEQFDINGKLIPEGRMLQAIISNHNGRYKEAGEFVDDLARSQCTEVKLGPVLLYYQSLMEFHNLHYRQSEIYLNALEEKIRKHYSGTVQEFWLLKIRIARTYLLKRMGKGEDIDTRKDNIPQSSSWQDEEFNDNLCLLNGIIELHQGHYDEAIKELCDISTEDSPKSHAAVEAMIYHAIASLNKNESKEEGDEDSNAKGEEPVDDKCNVKGEEPVDDKCNVKGEEPVDDKCNVNPLEHLEAAFVAAVDVENNYPDLAERVVYTQSKLEPGINLELYLLKHYTNKDVSLKNDSEAGSYSADLMVGETLYDYCLSNSFFREKNSSKKLPAEPCREYLKVASKLVDKARQAFEGSGNKQMEIYATAVLTPIQVELGAGIESIEPLVRAYKVARNANDTQLMDIICEKLVDLHSGASSQFHSQCTDCCHSN